MEIDNVMGDARPGSLGRLQSAARLGRHQEVQHPQGGGQPELAADRTYMLQPAGPSAVLFRRDAAGEAADRRQGGLRGIRIRIGQARSFSLDDRHHV